MASNAEINAAKAIQTPISTSSWSTSRVDLTTYIDVIGIKKMAMHTWMDYNDLKSAIKYVALDSKPSEDPLIPYTEEIERSERVGEYLYSVFWSNEYKNKFADDHGKSFYGNTETAQSIPEPAYCSDSVTCGMKFQNGFMNRLWLGWLGYELGTWASLKYTELTTNYRSAGMGNIQTVLESKGIPSGEVATGTYTYRLLLKAAQYPISSVTSQRDSAWRARAVGTLLYRKLGLTNSEASTIQGRGSVSNMANYVMNSTKYKSRLKS